MIPSTHLWPLLPALAVVLLHLDTFAHDFIRLTAWAWRLSREAKQRDAETTERERGV
jgi:hypothetical protein